MKETVKRLGKKKKVYLTVHTPCPACQTCVAWTCSVLNITAHYTYLASCTCTYHGLHAV